MRTLMKEMEKRLGDGEDLVLATIIAASGATPRGAGARMLVNASGRVCGTIGGGAVEYRSILMAQNVLREKQSRTEDFTLNKNDVKNLGMICGGDVRVLFQYINGGDESLIAMAEEIERQFVSGGNLWLFQDLGRGGTLSVYTKENAPEWAAPHLSSVVSRVQTKENDILIEQIVTSGRVYIFGGGHVAQELEPVLTHIGFRCIILEDRSEFARKELFPTAEQILLVDFRHLDQFIQLTEEDYVCIMTRGHSYDTLVQAQILRQPAKYIGVIGSKRKAAGVRRALLEEYGLSQEECDRAITPIGLNIGGETPAEIAISIAAQMIAVRSGMITMKGSARNV